jgi:hypothetical protein
MGFGHSKTQQAYAMVDVTEEAEKAKGAFSGVIKGCEAYLVANLMLTTKPFGLICFVLVCYF